jgi:cellulose synthase/poly-beta-1,6-N-acetylglucosamine synthase-like glycosyltransferase
VVLIIVGLALLVAWPVYAVGLFLNSGRSGTGAGRHREPTGLADPAGARPTTFWIVVPCLNEERVIGRTVAAALALRGPWGTRTRVLVVDDGSDDATPDVLDGLDGLALHVLYRDPSEARQGTTMGTRTGESEALNAAYRYIRDRTEAEVGDPRRVAVGVIGGDSLSSANMLTAVSHAMSDPRVGVVQSRVRIHNRDRILAAAQDLEFGCAADSSRSVRHPTGGNGLFGRLSALLELGGSPWSRDLAPGLRMHLASGGLRYLPHASVTQRGLVDAGHLMRQRTRWAQGNLQCARSLRRLFAARRTSNVSLAEMLHLLLAPWRNAGAAVGFAVLWIWAAGQLLVSPAGPVLVETWAQLGAAAAIWTGALLMPGLMWALMHRLTLRDERLSRLLLAGLVYPYLLVLGLVSTWRAIGGHLTRRETRAATERLADTPA